jgi:uracil-DNA glycosylase
MTALQNLEATDWWQPLQDKLSEDYWVKLVDFLNSQYAQQTIYPERGHVFRAYQATPLAQAKVVLVGQDPYHQVGQAQGLSFSVPNDMKRPPSLTNIFKELATDVGVSPTTNDLTPWAQQGVLLLNSVLTVPDSQANAHAGIIWEALTDATLQVVNEQAQPTVFVLWGKFAQSKRHLIDETRHLVLTSAHPSPLSAYRGFFGSRPFSQINDFLVRAGRKPIDWRLD